MTSESLTELSKYSACDIADALLKLNVPGAGFLADLSPIPTYESSGTHNFSPQIPEKVLASASTFLMVPKSTPSFPSPSPTPDSTPESNADTTPYADHTRPGTIVLISAPADTTCAVVGGIIAKRMTHLGARGILVDGRVRDLSALRYLDIPIWSKGTSVIGAGAQTKWHAKEVPIRIGEVEISPGDIVVIDEEENGVVVVPLGLVGRVVEMLPGMVKADALVEEGVEGGMSVGEAFGRYRK